VKGNKSKKNTGVVSVTDAKNKVRSAADAGDDERDTANESDFTAM
jgi:hypothetical protein